MADDVATVGGIFSEDDVGGGRKLRTLVNAIDDGLYQLDPRGHFVAVNDVIADVTGYDREELLGRHVSVVLDDADVERVETAIRGLLDSDPDTATLELEVETAAGDRIPCELRVNLLVDDGEFQGTVGVVRDVSDRKDRERELAETEQRFRSLVDAVEEYAIFMLDPDGRVVSWNEGARRLKGYDRGEILGEHFSTFYTGRDREAGRPAGNLAAAREEGSTEDEGWRVRADGSRFWANVTIRAIREDGELRGYAKVTRDMTERRRNEAERELLYETTRSIAEAETFADGLHAALRRICAATDWEFGEAWIPTGDVLRRADAEYYEPDLESFASASESVTFEPGEGLPGRVWASGDYEWAADLPSGSPERYPRIESAREVGMESALGVPILADGEVVAVLTFLTGELRAPDERAVELVSSVATKLGDLLRRRRAEQAHRREQALTEQVLRTSPVGIAVFSVDGEVERFNDRMVEIFDLPRDEAASHEFGLLDLRTPDGDPLPVDERPVERTIETGEPVEGQEVRFETADGRTKWTSMNVTPITDGVGDLERVVATATDVTRLKAQARRLERRRDELEAELDEMFERISDGFYALDGELRFTYVNDRAETLLGQAESSLIGRDLREAVALTDRFEAALRRALEEREPVFVEDYYEPVDAWFENAIYPSESGLSVYFRDVTERKEREREVVRYETLFEESKDVNVIVEPDGTFRHLTSSAANVFGYEPEELVGEVGFEYIHPEDRDRAMAEFAKMIETPGYEPEIEFRFERADGSWIVLEALARDLREDPDVEGIVIYTRDVTERKERERELERQRERLGALNSLHEAVQDVAEAAVEQSTREEIEEIVCERLADSGSYRFAWIGDVDPRTETVQLRSEAGVEGYLDGVTISTDPDDERSQGPTGRAVRTGEIQTTEDVRDDSRHDPWRDHVEEHGFRSSAAIPIVHDGTRYGVLNVYADRPAAFTGEEREVVGTLGEIVGHAIAAVERKRALLSDDVVELDLVLEDVLAAVDPEDRPDEPVRFDRTIPVGGEEYLGYGTVAEGDLADLKGLVDAVDHWQSIRVVRNGYDRVTFELRAVEPPLMTTVAARGGSIEGARLDGGDVSLTIQLPQEVDTRAIVDDVSEIYPGLTLRAQRQITRAEDGPRRVATAFAEELTERQRASLESAYYAGYFDWPRESSGQEVAGSLDVSAATFSQHLRTAERRIFEALFESPDGEP